MIRQEENKVDSIVLIKEHLKKFGEVRESTSRDNCTLFDFTLQPNMTRQIKLDTTRSFIIVYTSDPTLNSGSFNKEKLLYYIAYVNEGLSLTGLDYNMDTGEFRYKSSQSFPKGVNFIKVLEYLITLHDNHFNTLRSNIQKFMASNSDPNECAKEFLTSIR